MPVEVYDGEYVSNGVVCGVEVAAMVADGVDVSKVQAMKTNLIRKVYIRNRQCGVCR